MTNEKPAANKVSDGEHHDIHEIGEKVVKMADRLKVVAAACPGAQATWGLEIDDVQFQVTVTMKEPSQDKLLSKLPEFVRNLWI